MKLKECEARVAKCHQHCSRTSHGEANKEGDAHPHHTHAYTTRVVGERQGERDRARCWPKRVVARAGGGRATNLQNQG